MKRDVQSDTHDATVTLPRGVHKEIANFPGRIGFKAVTATGALAVRVEMAASLETPEYMERLRPLMHEMIECVEAETRTQLHIA